MENRREGHNVLGYASQANPITKSLAVRFTAVVFVGAMLPIIGLALPRSHAVRWPWVIAALAIIVLVLGSGLWDVRRLARAEGYLAPSLRKVHLQATLGLVSLSCFGYGVGTEPDFLRLIVLMVIVIIATVGSLPMTVLIWLTGLADLWILTSAGGSSMGATARVVAVYAVAWAVIALMGHVVATTAFGALSDERLLAEVAEISSKADDLASGLQDVLPVVGEYVGGRAICAYDLRSDGTPSGSDTAETLACWYGGAGGSPPPPPGPDDVSEALSAGGVRRNDRGVLLATAAGAGRDVVLSIEFDSSLYRPSDAYKLHLLLVQVQNLVNRTLFVEYLHGLTRTDPLTSLPNRRALMERLDVDLPSALRRDEAITVAMIDIDNFKSYNDTFGHLEGDALLRETAHALSSELRATDFVSRFGGEEFCLILVNSSTQGAVSWLDRAHQLVSRAGPPERRITFSAGVAQWNRLESGDEVIGRADVALYSAKAKGKDCTVVAEEDP